MSANDKSGYWFSQFQVSFPMVVARFWANRNAAALSADFDTVDVHQLMEKTQGSYAKEDLGRAMVELRGYHLNVLRDCVSEQSGMMSELANDHLPTDRLQHELSSIVGEFIFNGAPNVPAFRTTFPGKMSEIRKEAAKYKAVKGVMST